MADEREFQSPAEDSDQNELPPANDNNPDPVDTNAQDRREEMGKFLAELEGNDKPDPQDPPPPAEPPEVGELLDAELGGLPDDFEIPPPPPIPPDAPQTPQEPLPATFSEDSASGASGPESAADTLLSHLERFGDFGEDAGQSPDLEGPKLPDNPTGGVGGDASGDADGDSPEPDYSAALDADYGHRDASTDFLVEHTRKINELTARLERERI